MTKYRQYGTSPYTVVVLHGGPGAPGEMAPVAKELSQKYGVLEPLFSADTIDGQIKELKDILKEHGVDSVILIGWSWGAMLGFIFSAYFPHLVKKLILVSSGAFEKKYVPEITTKRLSYFSEEQKQLHDHLQAQLNDPQTKDKNQVFRQMGELINIADAYDPIPAPSELLDCQYDVYQGVWQEALELRNTGELLELSEFIQCPVTAIHGDYDPRPIEGVRAPLQRCIHNFRCIPLEKCGHHPWLEKHAKDAFYKILDTELAVK